jgi:hypothetical protein
MVAAQIRANWKEPFAHRAWHSRSDLAGILRTILSSVKVRSHPSPEARGYVVFVEKSLGKLRGNVRRLGPEELRQSAGPRGESEQPPAAE